MDRRARALIALLLATGAALGAAIACGDSPSANNPATTTPTSSPSSSVAPPVDGEAPGGDGAASDSGAADFAGCRQLLAESPGTPTGVHTIELGGDGSIPSLDVYCDMTFDGGGWTLIEAYTGTNSPSDLEDASAAGGYLVASPRPGTFGVLAGAVVQALAAKSSQVHVRMSFAADAASADPTTGLWITSRAPANDSATLPITNLRNLQMLTIGSDGGIQDWTGPSATYTKIGFSGTGCPPRPYPSMFWACGNPVAIGIVDVAGGGIGHCNWVWDESSAHHDPIEIYVR
jgi:hypothetical protein